VKGFEDNHAGECSESFEITKNLKPQGGSGQYKFCHEIIWQED
jgi:hypothetical protein